jgi:hypothetical protein
MSYRTNETDDGSSLMTNGHTLGEPGSAYVKTIRGQAYFDSA